MEKVRIEQYSRARGVTELARRCGYSTGHISLVLRGERLASRALAAKLKRMGYKVGVGVRKGAARKGGAE